jgi:hypothetical protein
MKQVSRGTRLSLGLASVAVAGVALGAAASALTSSAQHGTYRPPHLDGTRERMFSSLRSLAGASDAIVVATARSSTTSDEGGIPVTVTSVDVARTLRGSVAGTTIPIHQLGAPGDALEGVPVLQSGKTYLLFLTRFHYVPGDDTGQYVATGNPAGIFLQDGGKYLRLDRESTMLPSSTDESQVLQAS